MIEITGTRKIFTYATKNELADDERILHLV